MNQSKHDFSEILIEAFYNQPGQPNWAVLANHAGLTREECQRQWLALTALSQTLAQLDMREPEQIVINRLSVLAREDVQKVSFWQKFSSYRMSLSFALVMLFVVVVTRQGDWTSSQSIKAQKISQSQVAMQNHILNSAIQNRMLKTTLDEFDNLKMPFRKSKSKTGLQFSLATPVSVGNSSSYSFDSENDDDLYKSDLNSKEVESLFFRARKFEKQGYYREALKDYQFLAQFYPTFMHPQSLHIAMARCLEGLGQDDNAIELLQKSAARYGESDDLRTMVDQLKSVTF